MGHKARIIDLQRSLQIAKKALLKIADEEQSWTAKDALDEIANLGQVSALQGLCGHEQPKHVRR